MLSQCTQNLAIIYLKLDKMECTSIRLCKMYIFITKNNVFSTIHIWQAKIWLCTRGVWHIGEVHWGFLKRCPTVDDIHYNDVIMSTMASQITSVSIVYSTVCSDPDQRKCQNSASLAFVRGINRWPVNSPHVGPVTRKMFPFDDVIMFIL